MSDPFAERVAKVLELRESHPGNLSLQAFTRELFYETLTSDEQRERLLLCINTSIEVPDSEVGSYAMHASDYETLAPFFQVVLEGYHHTDLNAASHVTDWAIDSMQDDAKFAVSQELSSRVRVGRNLPIFDMCGLMSKEQRLEMENLMVGAFEQMMVDPEFGGRYVSLTPGHKYQITDEEYATLVKKHLMFKSMDKDAFLKAAGISRDWPFGRGAYVSEDEGFIVWVGEEDHLRIMCLDKKCMHVNKVFKRLERSYSRLESLIGCSFARNERFGFVSACPSNMGTCMRASVHIRLPALCQSPDLIKSVAKQFQLSVRGEHGEHSAFGEGGLVDISPKPRMMVTEAQILGMLCDGVQKLEEEEAKAAARQSSM